MQALYAGCTAKGNRAELKEHLESNKDEHLCQLGKTMKTELTSLAELGKNTRAELETLTFAFSKFVSKPLFISPPEMIMDNFEELKSEEADWYSPPFYTHIGGYKMCLNIVANGWGSGKYTHVSMTVHMMKGEFDSHLQWPFKGEITVQLVNQKEGGEHYERKPVEHRDTRAVGTILCSLDVKKLIDRLDGAMMNSYPMLISTNLKRVKST